MDRDGEDTLPVSRRVFVASSVLVATSTAGCGDLTQQSFEAPPVGLPNADREPLELSETTLDQVTISFDGPAGSTVELTNHTGVYDRTVGTGDE